MKKNNQFEKKIINLKKNFFPLEQYERISKGTLSSFNKIGNFTIYHQEKSNIMSFFMIFCLKSIRT